ncbi:MAG: C40 family peptidase [Deltaproteobacteria bacterium]|nr:C40 family peptidase [Deltaproteobacteria bacterium]
MIRRWVVFITIVLMMTFPVSSLHAASKSVSKKKTGIAKNKESQKTRLTGAKTVNKSKKSSKARHKRSKHLAQDTPQVPNPGTPLLKVTPLDNGKFLIEPLESSYNRDQGQDTLSLIKKPVFQESFSVEEYPAQEADSLPGFSQLLVKLSKQLLGTAYRLGGYGQGQDGIDCSGFMKKVYQTLTLNLPHSSREQAKMGALVTTDWDLSRLRIGDLLFFKRNQGGPIGHTGMYIGEGRMIHSSSRKGVIITNLSDSQYYNRNFVMARRLFIVDDADLGAFKNLAD